MSLNLVGETFFSALCHRYIKTNPSTSYDINNYGSTLSEFTEEFPATQSLVYLPDVMRLEWAYHRVFIAENETFSSLAEIAAFDESQLRRVLLCLPQRCALLKSLYPIHKIWRVNQSDYLGDSHVDLNEGGVHVFVFRRELNMHIEILDEAEWLLLQTVAAGDTLGSIQRQFPAELFTPALARLLECGCFARYSLRREESGFRTD